MALTRSNDFEIRPQTPEEGEILRRLLDASAALWNETNFERLRRYDDADGVEDESVWDADTGHLEGKYKGVLGAATAQQVIRKNSEAWRSFFRSEEDYYDSPKSDSRSHPNPPGFRGNREDGRELKTVIRNTSYSIEWGERSRLEILIGTQLKEEYDYTGRLRLEIRGKPNWPDYESQGRLDLWYDEIDDTFRASQPVTLEDERQASPLASETAALDVGANNLVACTTTTGEQYLYEGRSLFERFRETTQYIGELKSKLEPGQHTSHRITRLYRKRSRRRTHAQEALCRDLAERLHEAGVDTILVGDLSDVLKTHWSVETNAKTHNFWAHETLLERLEYTAEEYGMTVERHSEAWTSQECPDCGSTDQTTRHRDTLTCTCGFEGHADLAASRTFLDRHTDETVRLMAQPVRSEWDDHVWSELGNSHRPKGQRTDRSTTDSGGNLPLWSQRPE